MKIEELIKSAKEDLHKICEDEKQFEAEIEQFKKEYFENEGIELCYDDIIQEMRFEGTCYYPELINSTRATVHKALENYLSDTKFAKHNQNKAFEVGVHTARIHKKEIVKEIEKAQEALKQLDYLISVCDKYRDK